MTSLYPFWCNNGGPFNRKIVVSVNSLLLTIKALNFASGVFHKQVSKSEEKLKVIFLIAVALLKIFRAAIDQCAIQSLNFVSIKNVLSCLNVRAKLSKY